MTLIVRVIARTEFLGVPRDLFPSDVRPMDLQDKHGQDVGTQQERLIECAGRVCYDSYTKGRGSAAYHNHIMDVDHGSVTEHVSLSYFLSGVSRGLTHELVRHRVGVAISQRSTRYVDENESEWIWHPLIEAFNREVGPEELRNGAYEGALMRQQTAHVREEAQRAYAGIVTMLQNWLTSKGVDKLTARKQARGAARGLLGNALMTEMVWTCNLRALKTFLGQRAKAAADAEIRVCANRLYEEALPYFPTYLGRYQKRPCPDGIGYELYVPDPKDAEIERLRTELGVQALELSSLRREVERRGPMEMS
jgi:thymidylate synthase (FAD)